MAQLDGVEAAASGMATGFIHTAAPAPGLLPALRNAGYANAARYPLSATAQALDELGRRLIGRAAGVIRGGWPEGAPKRKMVSLPCSPVGRWSD